MPSHGARRGPRVTRRETGRQRRREHGHGFGHQEAAQADGEEEAPQAAEEDPRPATQQEVERQGLPPSVVLVTGVSRWLGGALAAELATDPSIERIIGVDTVPPSADMLRRLGRTEFVRADIRNPLIGKVIANASVDTVVHMNTSPPPAGPGGRGPMKELNVIGTMQLLAACQRASSVRRFVLKSTSAV